MKEKDTVSGYACVSRTLVCLPCSGLHLCARAERMNLRDKKKQGIDDLVIGKRGRVPVRPKQMNVCELSVCSVFSPYAHKLPW